MSKRNVRNQRKHALEEASSAKKEMRAAKRIVREAEAVVKRAEQAVITQFYRGVAMAVAEITKRADRCCVGVEPNTPSWIIAKIQEHEARHCAALVESYCRWKEEERERQQS